MIPEPRENPVLFGHADARATFAEAMRSGRMHHAWLLAGPSGVGKATLAYGLARHLLTSDGDPDDPGNPVFRRVARGSHADLLTIERAVDSKTRKQKRDVSVDQVRDVAGFMHLTAAEGGWRIVLVDGAEDMNRNAANALLKVLEEPPKRAILLLTSDAPGRLLPTIRSRCRRLRLEGLGEADMTAALQYLLPNLDPAERTGLLAMVDGSPGRAVRMAGEGGLAIAALVQDVLRSVPVATIRAYEVADQVTRGEGGFAAFMELLQAGIVDRVRQTAQAGERAMSDRPLAEWGEVWHAIGHLHDETERFSLDKRTAVVAGLQLLTRSEQAQ